MNAKRRFCADERNPNARKTFTTPPSADYEEGLKIDPKRAAASAGWLAVLLPGTLKR